MLDSRPYSPEQACFPAVAQIGKVFRKTSGRRPETVYIISSREPSAMNAEQWLVALRQYWGIENGVHQRVDASANEDRSRVRTVNAVWVMGMFRRLAVSLYAEWRSRSENRRRASLHDFHNLMARHNKKHAYSLVSALSPSLNWRIMK
jgi:predicted transposase YbfD/YdcC